MTEATNAANALRAKGWNATVVWRGGKPRVKASKRATTAKGRGRARKRGAYR